MHSDKQLSGGPDMEPDETCGHLVRRPVDELHQHPSFVRHHLTVASDRLSALAQLGDLAFRDPLVITADGTILDGNTRWKLACLQGRRTLPCLQYQMNDTEALQYLIRAQCGSSGLNDFCRILLGLELEPWLREKALSNQRAGGQNKGSSKLTKAGIVDVRSQIARAAGVCEGNVTKVKQLLVKAPPEIFEALRTGEIRIHRGWKWSEQSLENQIAKLTLYRNKRGINKKIKSLISRHKPVTDDTLLDPASVFRRLCALSLAETALITVSVIKANGRVAYLSEGLLQTLGSQQELTFTCARESH